MTPRVLLTAGASPHSLTESDDVISMCINDEGNLAALNIATQGVHLWDLQVQCVAGECGVGIVEYRFLW